MDRGREEAVLVRKKTLEASIVGFWTSFGGWWVVKSFGVKFHMVRSDITDPWR